MSAECAVCFTLKRLPITLRCGHTICRTCKCRMRNGPNWPWNRRCPLCRLPFVDGTVEELRIELASYSYDQEDQFRRLVSVQQALLTLRNFLAERDASRPNSESASDSAPEAAREAVPESDTEAAREAVPESDTETAPEAVPESDTETAPEADPESDTETAPETTASPEEDGAQCSQNSTDK